jgi:hypothetical protein
MIYEQTRTYMPGNYSQINGGTPPYNPFGPVIPITEPRDPIRIYDPALPSIGQPSKTYIWC